MKTFWTIVIIILVIAIGFWIFSGDDIDIEQEIDENFEEEMNEVDEDEDTSEEESNVIEIMIEGYDDFSFSMDEIDANEGDTVRVTFRNVGDMPHDFNVEGIEGASTSILNGDEEETIEFTVSEAGVYEYYCSVGSHRELGMTGTLTVN